MTDDTTRLGSPGPAVPYSELAKQLSAILNRGYLTSPDPESGAMDLTALRHKVDDLGEAGSEALLQAITDHLSTLLSHYSRETHESYRAHAETVLAVLGRRRPEITKRFRNHAQAAVRALGAFPLADGETVADRYRQLEWSAKQVSKFGAERRANHLLCVRAAKEHLAQVGGFPDVTRMEFALDADVAAEAADAATGWTVGEYRLSLAVVGADAELVVERSGRRLKAVPKAVRAEPAYGEAREVQERLRGQARRLRLGLLEELIAEGKPIDAADLVRLLRIPAGRVMIPALIWRTEDGRIGLLESGSEDGGAAGLLLHPLDAPSVSVTGPLHAAHPADLFQAGALGAWQQAVVTRRLVQPVRQAFRELYLLTPAEAAAGSHSHRFAGHRVSGPRTSRLLAGRGWRVEGYDDGQTAVRRFGDHQARLAFAEIGHYLGEGEAVTGTIHFRHGAKTLDLAEVPAVVLSEAMRDVDLVVSVAGIGGDRPYSAATAATRGDLLTALAGDLGLDTVRVDGAFARIRGRRADYRVHLGSGSVHIEPGGYLCVVPDAAAAARDRDSGGLFLPFADEDVLTGVILSKVLLLAADDRITDPSITAQIDRATSVSAGDGPGTAIGSGTGA